MNFRFAVFALTTVLLSSTAQAQPTFSNYDLSNVGDVVAADMSLGAPIPAFKLSCTGTGGILPYRLEILVDPINASYQEFDRSDEPTNPGVWSGNLTSARVSLYFPTRDGIPTSGYRISHVSLNGDLWHVETMWTYSRRNALFRCFSDEAAGVLSADLIEQLKIAGTHSSSAQTKPSASDGSSAVTSYCATVRDRVFATRADAAKARELCNHN